ncbi:ABC transporter ATP-binding protein [Brucellaceae bacterium C25G]
MTTLLSIQGLKRHFNGIAAAAVNDVSFDLAQGEILALIGPSGCGKTTTLRMIAGFETPDSGTITFAGKEISHLPPEKRQLGMVFQDYALFPHLTVRDNVLFGAQEKKNHIAENYLAMVDLKGYGERFPDELSGGQQQRVALARSLAAEPKVILLDEPFSNLDAALRQNTRMEIRRILKSAGVGVIVVTHDQEEALGFADRIAVMQNGNLLQTGTGQQVYDEPINGFVASFLGRANFINAEADGLSAISPIGAISLEKPAYGKIQIVLRPEAIILNAENNPTDTSWQIINQEFRGAMITYSIERNGTVLLVDTTSKIRLAVHTHVSINIGLAHTITPE